MLWVVTQKGRNKETRKRVSKFEDGEMETAVALAEQIVTHNKVSCLIFLQNQPDEKPLLLRRIHRSFFGKMVIR